MSEAPAPAQPDSAPTQKLELNHTLHMSIKDGMCAATSMGLGETYVGVFAIFLKASTFQIGLLASLPPLIGSISQLFAVGFVRRLAPRKNLLVNSVIANAAVWIPIALLAIWIGSAWAPAILIALYCGYHFAGGLGAPAWNSIMGDVVPSSFRGRYFGLRNRNVGFCSVLGILAGGVILEAGEYLEATAAGFAIIFLLSSAFRFGSAYFLNRHIVPTMPPDANEYFSIWQFLKRTPFSNFGKFVWYVSLINAAVAFAGPFFAVYMLETLHLSYMEFMVATVSVNVAQFTTMQYWGTITDRFGAKKVLNVCGILISFAPFLWFFASSMPELIALQMVAGFVWAGFNLAAGNFLFDAVSPPKRARCAAYQSVINAVLVICGALLGAYAAQHLPSSFTIAGGSVELRSPLLLVFGISGILRLIAALCFLPRFVEERQVERIGHKDLLIHIVNFHGLSEMTFDVFTGRKRRSRAQK